jgi:hypothetical protein
MADPTLATRPVIPHLQDWLASHAGSIRNFAGAVGLEPSLVAAGPLQEASTIIGREFSSKHQMPIAPGVYERIFDFFLDSGVSQHGHGSIAADFASRKSDILAGKAMGRLPKLWNPTGNDIGYANINLGTAILYLQRYLQYPEDYLADRAQAARDPLKLRRYANDYAKLAADLIDPNSDAAWAIAALIAKDGHNIFSAFYGPQFTQASEDSRAAYITTFFKQGEAKILQKIPDAGAMSRPPMSRPEEGSGGPFTIDNFRVLKQILDGPDFGALDGHLLRFTQPTWSNERQASALATPGSDPLLSNMASSDARGLRAVDPQPPFYPGPEPALSEPAPITDQRGPAAWHLRQATFSASPAAFAQRNFPGALGRAAPPPGAPLEGPGIVNRMVSPLSGLPVEVRQQPSIGSTGAPLLPYVGEPRGMLSPLLDGDFTGVWTPLDDGRAANAPVRYHDPQLGNGAPARLVNELNAAIGGAAFGAPRQRRTVPFAFGGPSLEAVWRDATRDG